MSTHVRGQRNNHRLFPGARQPCQNDKTRKLEALERQKAWSNLSSTQKLQELDRRLGKGVGAVKQRTKLALEAPGFFRHCLNPNVRSL